MNARPPRGSRAQQALMPLMPLVPLGPGLTGLSRHTYSYCLGPPDMLCLKGRICSLIAWDLQTCCVSKGGSAHLLLGTSRHAVSQRADLLTYCLGPPDMLCLKGRICSLIAWDLQTCCVSKGGSAHLLLGTSRHAVSQRADLLTYCLGPPDMLCLKGRICSLIAWDLQTCCVSKGGSAHLLLGTSRHAVSQRADLLTYCLGPPDMLSQRADLLTYCLGPPDMLSQRADLLTYCLGPPDMLSQRADLLTYCLGFPDMLCLKGRICSLIAWDLQTCCLKGRICSLIAWDLQTCCVSKGGSAHLLLGTSRHAVSQRADLLTYCLGPPDMLCL